MYVCIFHLCWPLIRGEDINFRLHLWKCKNAKDQSDLIQLYFGKDTYDKKG